MNTPLLRIREPFALALGAALLSALLTTQPLHAQDHFPVNGQPWSYVVPPFNGHCSQTYRLFLPPTPHQMPADGWPVLVHVKLSGFWRSEDSPQLSPESALARFLDKGIAVVTARVTPSLLTNDPRWLDLCGSAPQIPGHGLFHPPGFIPPDLAAQGIAPYEHPDYHMAEKDCVMLLQHVRFKARQVGGFKSHLDIVMARLDHRRIAVQGSSAAAISLMWAVLGPDRRHSAPFAGLPGQYAESSRADVVALDGGIVWWPQFSGTLEFPTSHFGFQGHSELPAPFFGDVLPAELLGNSSMYYEDSSANAQLPLYLSYGEISVSEDYKMRFDKCGPYPLCFDKQGQEGVLGDKMDFENFHPAWNGYTWITAHENAPTRLAITGEDAFNQKKGLSATPLFGTGNETVQQTFDMHWDDLAVWTANALDDLLNQLPPTHWHDLGNGLAGTLGVPTLTGSGSLLGGQPVTLSLTNAPPNAPVIAVAGLNLLVQPVMGGVLVPSPDLLVVGAALTNANGQFSTTESWPAGVPGGVSTYFQFWFPDPGAPLGFTATNALAAVAP
jgi:hypothetical protein